MGVEIFVLSSVALISNIGLLIAEALTGKPNEKETTFNEEPSPDDDEFETIFISDFYVFDKTIVYRRGLLGKRHKYTWRPAHHSSSKKIQKHSSDSSDFWNRKIMHIFFHLTNRQQE